MSEAVALVGHTEAQSWGSCACGHALLMLYSARLGLGLARGAAIYRVVIVQVRPRAHSQGECECEC